MYHEKYKNVLKPVCNNRNTLWWSEDELDKLCNIRGICWVLIVTDVCFNKVWCFRFHTAPSLCNYELKHCPVLLSVFLINAYISQSTYPANIYLFKVNNRNSRKRCEICSKLTIKTSEWRHSRPFRIFIVNVEHISHLFLVFLFLNLNK